MKTAATALALLAFATATALAEQANTREVEGAPWFCHGLDCPAYKVVNKTNKYEIRKLEGGKWAATKVESLLYSVGVSEGFQKLFKYISGDNEDKQKVDMTVPVVTRIVPGDGPFCKSTFSVHFFVPFKYQRLQQRLDERNTKGRAQSIPLIDRDEPPKPSNPDVHIEDVKSDTFAVAQFGGFLVDDYTLTSKAKSLEEALEADKITFENDSYFAAGYDPPFRHNEVWIKLPSGKQEQVITQ